MGNRLVQNADGALTTSTYDLANQLKTSQDASGVTPFTFDGAGNQHLTEHPDGTRTTSVWDDENREVRGLLPDGKITTNAFRSDGLRYEKQDSEGTHKTVYDGQNYLMEMKATKLGRAISTSLSSTGVRRHYEKLDQLAIARRNVGRRLGSHTNLHLSLRACCARGDSGALDAGGDRVQIGTA